MFSSMTIGKKLIAGFGVLILLGGLVGAIGWRTQKQVLQQVAAVVQAEGLAKRSLKGLIIARDYIITKNAKDEKAAVALNKDFHKRVELLATQLNGSRQRERLNRMEREMDQWLKAFHGYAKLEGEQNKAKKEMSEAFRATIGAIGTLQATQQAELLTQANRQQTTGSFGMKDILILLRNINNLTDMVQKCRTVVLHYMIETNQSYVKDARQTFANVISSSKKMRKTFTDPYKQQASDDVISNVQTFQKVFNDYVDLQNREDRLAGQMLTYANRMQVDANALSKGKMLEMKSLTGSSTSSMLLLGLLGLVLGVLGVFFLNRSITKPLRRVIDGLNDSAAQIVSASGQLASASQALAEGSSEQAASVEETSASLEQMSSMTRHNSENAGQAKALASDAEQVMTDAHESMNALTESMQEISAASEKTSKIVKTIDEIAFQTNLLALNAAVEAARAGEAGAGFAVVADEVRNLAMRAADAARDTGTLIEDTIKKIGDGAGLTLKTKDVFGLVGENAAKNAELVAEIAAASHEQAQGIEQISKAVVQLEKVIQQNAANAEESASVSKEMSAQSTGMKSFVKDLAVLVGGNGSMGKTNGTAAGEIAPEAKGGEPLQSPTRTMIPPGARTNGHAHPESAAQLIPFEEDF